MDWSTLSTSLQNALGMQLPNILGALNILIVGWVIAVVARAGTMRLLVLLSVDQRIRESTRQGLAVERGIAVGGFWLANLAYGALARVGSENARGLARLAQVAIIGLVVAMGLRAMRIADGIVNLAFGLTLGAVAVAIALFFGLGGRQAAGRQMELWLSKLRKDG